jgi:phenylpropionate dioxygenase-like ring-hydroxylating dioxygenase large terminal subunit
MAVDGQKVRGDRQAHRSVYTDPEILRGELRRIVRASWLYVAHEGEIPNPGDFKSLTLAKQPVIVVRGEDGRVRVLFNVCRHRAVTVCRAGKGNAKHFVCARHGWVYDTKGSLVGVRGPGRSVRGFEERRGLAPVPRVESYRGFIFASFNPEGESPDTHLGEARRFIDRIAEQSAEGIRE